MNTRHSEAIKTLGGGPAFPAIADPRLQHTGMTLRDYFAGLVAAGLSKQHLGPPESIAQDAYDIAQAMVEEGYKRDAQDLTPMVNDLADE